MWRKANNQNWNVYFQPQTSFKYMNVCESKYLLIQANNVEEYVMFAYLSVNACMQKKERTNRNKIPKVAKREGFKGRRKNVQ